LVGSVSHCCSNIPPAINEKKREYGIAFVGNGGNIKFFLPPAIITIPFSFSIIPSQIKIAFSFIKIDDGLDYCVDLFNFN